MRRFVLFLLLFVFLAYYQSAHAVIVSSSTPSSSNQPVYVADHTRIQYFPAQRVAISPEGDLMVCPYGAWSDWHECESRHGSTQAKNAWTVLINYQQVGYFLQHVQINETHNGPALVLFWYPTPEVLAADKKKHP